MQLSLSQVLAGSLLTLCLTTNASAGGGSLPGTEGGPCASTEPMGGGTYDVNMSTCDCSGKGPDIDVTGSAQIGGFSVGVGGSTPADPEQLVCTSYVVLGEYDAYKKGGTSTVEPGLYVDNLLFDVSCDTSGCYRFLLFKWGKAKCIKAAPIKLGGHQSYVVTGESCTPPPPDEPVGVPTASSTNSTPSHH